MFPKLAIVAFLGGVSGLRKRRRSGGVPGEVHGLFTFGAPGSSTTPLTNHRSSTGCFPGYRVWTKEKQWIGSTIDIVAPLAGVAGFKHLKQPGLQLNVHDGSYETFACSDGSTRLPSGWHRKRTHLHSKELYSSEASKVNTLMYNVSNVGLLLSYEQDSAEAARRASELGWKLMFTASQDGKGTRGGFQVAHLFQQQDTSDCILTFQGSLSLGDWTANFDGRRASFCGLSQEVHMGFRNHLLRITGSPVWQNEIKSYLPRCSKVNVVGHSLGAATGELFTACVQRAPRVGEEGYEHYKIMGWNTDTRRASKRSKGSSTRSKGSSKRSNKGR